jgi:hypothetical protein
MLLDIIAAKFTKLYLFTYNYAALAREKKIILGKVHNISPAIEMV